jgi:hypothetical protein
MIGPAADGVDRNGAFCRRESKPGRGLCCSAPEVGGQGEARRHRSRNGGGACGSTAMVTLMHYAAVPALEALGRDPGGHRMRPTPDDPGLLEAAPEASGRR